MREKYNFYNFIILERTSLSKMKIFNANKIVYAKLILTLTEGLWGFEIIIFNQK